METVASFSIKSYHEGTKKHEDFILFFSYYSFFVILPFFVVKNITNRNNC